MARINHFLNERTKGEKYATVFYCTVQRDGLLRYSNAGHPKPMVVRKNLDLLTLKTTGMPLGMLSIATYEAGGGKGRPTRKALLAEALALTGDLDNALELLDEVIAQIERPGWEERFAYAELLRLKGWMLEQRGMLDQAETSLRASIDVAREQHARSWELRAATSLAKLMSYR